MIREVFLVASVLASCVYGIGHYTIVAPKNIRAHSDYQVSVTLHNQTEPAKIKLSILDGDKYQNEVEVTVDSAKPELVTLHLDEIEPNASYKLVAEGLSGIVFKEESDLSVEKKNVSLFIQTDKAIYKPGETIKFRVLVLDQHLRPAAINKGDLTVHISDAQSNRIKQWKDVSLIKGVLSDELQLSELPILGDWTITAEVGDETKKKTIEIAEYVLPKFEVTIDSSTQFSAKAGKIRAIIRSKYTYGKFVKGEATVSLTRKNTYHYSDKPEVESAVIKTIKVDGKGSVEFDVEEDLKPKFEEYRNSFEYELRASVIEELTGLNQTATKGITLHQTRYKFDAIDLDTQFKKGLQIEFTLTIKHHDDSLVPVNENTKEVVLVKVPNQQGSENVTETYFKFELNENGSVAVKLPTSTREENGFNIKVKFNDEEYNIGYFYPHTEVEKPDFAVKILKKVILNEPFYAEIESKEPIDSFTYQLIARGKIITADTVSVPDRNYHVIEFPATFDLAPTAHLVVYYFKGDEIQSAHTEIEVREDLNNYLKLKLSAQKTKPGATVDIDVSTNPKSYVGLLGVDQSVLLLKKNEELNKDDAFNEIDQYQSQVHEKTNYVYGRTPYYSNSYWNHFRSCKVILFTNAKKDEYMRRRILKKKVGAHMILDSMPEMALAAFPDSQLESNAPTPQIRKDFPETWLWQSITDDNFNGTQTIQKTVPDTITSWVITGFSVDPVNGLGLTKNPKILEVFQPFFVSLNLPYSVKRGEVLTVPVVVFNYLNDDADTEVTLHNEHQEFEFVGTNDDNKSDKGQELSRKKDITVPSNNGASTSFVIRPTKVGPISIKVVATTALAGDAVNVILPVEAEGVPQFVNKALLVDLRDVASLESTLTAAIPENAVPDSAKVEVNCVGDLLGGTIKNLHQLIRMPCGCGEQNMLNFVPNIVILNYLKATGQLKPEIEKKTKKYTETGYQRELTYRHDDGSFSAFGKSDRNGSTWLTAFVAKSFRQAAAHIDVEESIIVKALDWLSQKQSANGSFPEVGKVSHKDMQGGSGNGVALTAYTLITFLENKDKTPQYQETIEKAIENIVTSLEGVDDVYALGLASYALQLANHKSKDEVQKKFLAQTNTKDGLKWWRKSIVSDNYWGKETKTINVEITSYGLLALLDANQFNDGFPYFKWLLNQRNDQGGFEGTQDTVVGLQALAKFAERISTKENNVQVVVSAKDTNETHINVNPDNTLIYQSVELPSSVRSIDVKATGKGFALLQLSYRYNLDTVDASPAFTLKSKLNDGSNEGHISLEVCCSYNPKENEDDQSNMAVLEVSLPSGFTAEKDLLYKLTKTENVKKVETKNGETTIVIYFDSLSKSEVCVTIDGYRTHQVAEKKPAAIVIYDYYDNSRSARDFYTIP